MNFYEAIDSSESHMNLRLIIINQDNLCASSMIRYVRNDPRTIEPYFCYRIRCDERGRPTGLNQDAPVMVTEEQLLLDGWEILSTCPKHPNIRPTDNIFNLCLPFRLSIMKDEYFEFYGIPISCKYRKVNSVAIPRFTKVNESDIKNRDTFKPEQLIMF